MLSGDSDLKNVARRRIDSTGNTHVKTFRGATVAQLINIISTGACYPQVEQVTVTTGTSGCAGNTPCDIADYQKLLSAIKVHFPTAKVAAAATAPRLSGDVTYDTIAALNKGLGNLCVSNKVHCMRLSTP